MFTEDARNWVTAFGAAQEQVAVQTNAVTRPMLMNARGSTEAAEALQACFDIY